MEAVRAFNNELSSLYESKPPISRAKMAHVTKCAIKAIKFYKHVVQSVEKFIQKCKPEYKVPGLYVIDSVVRQSRHQFGSQKDVFAPRFTKNIITTFQNLFKCPGDERSKIVRVLNLWQKNEVFPSEIIQPLLDLAADPTKPSLIAAAQSAVDGVLTVSGKSSSSQPQPPQQDQQSAPEQPLGKKGATEEGQLSQSAAESMLATQNDMLNTVTQLLQQTDSGNKSLSAQQQQLQQLQLLQQQLIQQTQLMQQPTGAAPIIDGNLLSQIQALTNQLLSKTELKPDGERFNKKLLDFDYGESDDEEERRHQGDHNMAGNVQTILNDSSLMQQIHQVSQTIQSNEQLQSEISEQEQRRRVLEQQQAEFDQQISQPPSRPFSGPPPAEGYREEGEYEEEQLQDEDFRDHQQMRDRDDRDRRERRRRSRDRSRTPKRRRRTRSRSRDRRRRSRSRERHRRSRSKDREREKQKEKERERQKKSLPPLKENCVGVCTTTIWIGHLNKFTQEEELKEELERYGPVENISMVPPRGCAYVVMSNRKDAYKAISRLRGFKLNGSALKTAWAQSTGMREAEYKEGWDVENGVKYIPYDSLPADLSSFLEGAILDSESLPKHLKDIPTEKLKTGDHGDVGNGQANTQTKAGETQPPQLQPQSMLGMVPQPGMMPPGLPGMMPNMMMPMQRPMVPGLPPQAMGMPPRGPPQMMPGAPPLAGMPGAPVPAGMTSMSVANSSPTVVPQSLQNVVAVSGSLPTSPAVAARPGFPPGAAPPRFGFNPNLPPPGFRLPPPGFGMRPLLPGMPNSTPENPNNQDNPPVQKQPEMAWPPDSNEKDDEDDDINENGDKSMDSSHFKPAFGNQPSAPVPPGTEQSPLRMLGPPGAFPPQGPPGSPWSMRFGGPRPMRPLGGMPPMPSDNPDMFNSMPPLLGPRGPRFMGNRLGMPGSPGFPRPPMMRGVMRPPVSLLELDIKPPENFEGETFEEENIKNDEDNDKSDSEDNWKDGGGSYPNNSWQNVRESRDRNHDRSHREDDRNRDRNSRNRDRDRDRDRSDSRHRDRDRNWERDREERHRDRRSSRDRDRGSDRDRDRGSDRDRGRGDRDWRKHEDNRDSRGERKEEKERERTRPSRWSNIEDKQESEENPKEKEAESSLPIETSQTLIATPQITEPTPTEAAKEIIENVTDTNTVNMDIESMDMDVDVPSESICENLEQTDIVLSEQHANVGKEEATLADTDSLCMSNTDNTNATETTSTQSSNGPVTEDVPTIVQSCKLDSVFPDEHLIESQTKEDNSENKEKKESLELEEGEISS